MPQQRARMPASRPAAQHAPLPSPLQVPITSELGCVTPWLVTPGPWSAKEIEHHARALAEGVEIGRAGLWEGGLQKAARRGIADSSSPKPQPRLASHPPCPRPRSPRATAGVAANCSCNCLAPKVVLLAEEWDQADAFIAAFKAALGRRPAAPPYYPGLRQRYEAFKASYSQVSGAVWHPAAWGPAGWQHGVLCCHLPAQPSVALLPARPLQAEAISAAAASPGASCGEPLPYLVNVLPRYPAGARPPPARLQRPARGRCVPRCAVACRHAGGGRPCGVRPVALLHWPWPLALQTPPRSPPSKWSRLPPASPLSRCNNATQQRHTRSAPLFSHALPLHDLLS